MMEGIGQLNYYVRDASGKVLAIYNGDGSQAEVPIYGASRLGINFNNDMTSYQLSNHLGNVRATVSWSGVSRSINNYSDFYPFGMKIGYQTDGKYRYGYQGEFAEDETDETGFNSFEARMYDPVIGRWMSVDPARQHASPYLAMSNNPIVHGDLDGLWDWNLIVSGSIGAVGGALEFSAGLGTTSAGFGVLLMMDGGSRFIFGLSRIAAGFAEESNVSIGGRKIPVNIGQSIGFTIDHFNAKFHPYNQDLQDRNFYGNSLMITNDVLLFAGGRIASQSVAVNSWKTDNPGINKIPFEVVGNNQIIKETLRDYSLFSADAFFSNSSWFESLFEINVEDDVNKAD